MVFLYLPADKFCEMVTTETLDDMLDRLQRRRVRWNVTVLVDGLYSMVQSKRNYDFQRSVNPLAPVSAAAQKAAEKLRMLPFARTEDVDDYREKQRFARGVNFAFFDSTKQCCEYLKTVTRQLAKSRYDVHDSRVALAKSRPTAAMRVESMLESSQHSNSSGGDSQSLSRSQSGSQASGLSRTNSNSIYSDLPRYERTFAHSWVNWWMQVPGISESKASAIVTKYPTLRRLLMAYANARASSSSVSPEQLLQDVRIASSDRPRLGPVISKKVFAILHSTDPHVNIQ